MGIAVPEIPGHMAPPEITAILQRQVANLLQRKSIGFPGAQPVSFARHHIQDNLLQEDYYVCEKSDGIRCLMYLTSEDGNERVFLITRKNEYFLVPDLHFPLKDDMASFHVGALIDGELVLSKVDQGPDELKYLVFDCLALDNRSLVNRTLDKRLGYLNQGLRLPYEELCRRYPEDCNMFPFRIAFKEMELSYGLPKIFNEVIPKLKHVSDGLIFTCRNSSYVFGTDDKILKWKPPEENTVDFLMTLEFSEYTDPDTNETYLDYDSKPILHLNMWAGKSIHEPFSEMYITDEEWEKLKNLKEPLDSRIVETFKDSKGRWRYMRFRDDKENGNHQTTVFKVLESIGDSVTKEELLKACPKIREKWKEREEAFRAVAAIKRPSVDSDMHNKRIKM